MAARRVGGLWVNASGEPATIVANSDGTAVGGGICTTIRGTLNAVSPGVLAAAGDYAANDVLSQSASDTVGVHWVFADAARSSGGSGWVTKLRVTSSVEGLTARLRLWLFDADPSASEKDDNAAFNLVAADRAKCLGYIDLPAMIDAGAVSFSQNTTERFRYVCATGSTSLFGIVQTLDAITGEAASMTLDLHMTVDQD